MALCDVKALAARRDHIALTPFEMNEPRGFLADHYGIGKLPDGADICDAIRAACGDDVADKYEDLNEVRAQGSDAEYARATKGFYDFICMEPLLGLVHSQKWPLILDAAAYLTVIVRTLNAGGPNLDVGCHAGYMTLWLARAVGVDIKGVDASKAAIRMARKKGKVLSLCPVPASLDSMQFPKQRPRGKVNMIYSVDEGVDLESNHLAAASKLLADNGVLVWIGRRRGRDAAELRATLAAAKLSLLMADVVGGWDGNAFDLNMVLVMTQGADPDVPADV